MLTGFNTRLQYPVSGHDQAGACLLFDELSLQRPPALTSADRAVLATYGIDAASVWLNNFGLWETCKNSQELEINQHIKKFFSIHNFNAQSCHQIDFEGS